jgi:hypothetical protein
MNVYPLPPKMAAQYANRAKAGEGKSLGHGVYVFQNGREEITLVSLDPPSGHYVRRSGANP